MIIVFTVIFEKMLSPQLVRDFFETLSYTIKDKRILQLDELKMIKFNI